MSGESGNMIQSLTRGLTALEYVLEHREARPGDIASLLGINRSSAYRLLTTLADMGYLCQDRKTQKYSAVPSKFAALYSYVAEAGNFIDLIKKYMPQLVNATGETATLGIINGKKVVYVSVETSDNVIQVSIPMGTERDIYTAALGKALVAYLPDDQIEKILSELAYKQYTARTITDKNVLRYSLKTIREKGYAIDDEEFNEGVRCIAAPVFNKNGHAVAALGISGPSIRITNARIEELARCVMECAKQASTELSLNGI